MKQYRQLISNEYKNKHFPNGYFASLVAESHSAKSNAGYIVGFIALGFLFNIGFIFGALVLVMNDKIPSGFWVCMGIGLVQLLLSSLILRHGKKVKSKTAEDWIAETVQNSHCSESAVREFDRQMMTSDISVLTLNGKVDSVLEYFLTDDFIKAGPKMAPIVIPIRDIIGVCFTYQEEFYSVGSKVKTRKSLAVGICTDKLKYTIFADRDLGNEFFAMLKSKNPNIKIKNDEILSEKAFDQWVQVQQEVSVPMDVESDKGGFN